MPAVNLSAVAGGSGSEIGDYIQTERATLTDGRVLLDPIGQIPNPTTYPLLTAAIDPTEKQTNVALATSAHGRSFTVLASGTIGYVGDSTSNTIGSFDMSTGVYTARHSSATIDGYYSAACSDDGQSVYFVGYENNADSLILVRSVNGGTNWTEVLINDPGYSAIVNTTQTDKRAKSIIQCNANGTSIRCIIAAGVGVDFTMVFESTDSGATWSEILTPRVALTAPSTNVYNAFISRDLSTVGIMQGTDGLNQRYLSIGGTGTLTDVEATLPLAPNDDHQTAVSVDGNSLFMFNNDRAINSQLVYFSTDNAATWTEVAIGFYASVFGAQSLILSAQFHPTDNDKVYLQVSEGSVSPAMMAQYSLILSTGKLVKLGSWNNNIASNAPFSMGSQHSSSIVIDGTSVRYCSYDGQTKDTTAVITFDTGKYLADTRNSIVTTKIVADAP